MFSLLDQLLQVFVLLGDDAVLVLFLLHLFLDLATLLVDVAVLLLEVVLHTLELVLELSSECIMHGLALLQLALQRLDQLLLQSQFLFALLDQRIELLFFVS